MKTTAGAVSSVEHGLAVLAEGLEEVLCAAGAPLDAGQQLAALRGVEVMLRKIPAVQHLVLAQCVEQRTASALGHKKLDVLLQQVLRISLPAARARIRAAELCGPRWTLSGEVLEPTWPATAAAAHVGLVGVEHTKIIGQILRKLPVLVGQQVYAQVEETLAGYASAMTPEGLQAVGTRLLAHLNPDGCLSDDADRARRRGVGVGRQDVDLLSGLSGTLTPGCRAKLDAVFATLGAPGAATGASAVAGSGGDADLAAATDTRTQSQRNHDALEAMCDQVLASGTLGSHRGVPATVIITMSLGDLERGAGQASTASGAVLPIRDALVMAQRCHPVLVVFDHNGRPLHLGRGRRLANADQRLALIATEGGCTKPGCTEPPDRCQAHHIREWEKGGRTNVDELTLVCDGDHDQVTDTPTGWTTPRNSSGNAGAHHGTATNHPEDVGLPHIHGLHSHWLWFGSPGRARHARSGGVVLEHLKCPVGVAVHLGLTGDHGQHGAVGANDERCPLHRCELA